MVDKNYAEAQSPNYSGFVVIGAGLPRTGTLSTRSALGTLLDGKKKIKLILLGFCQA